MDAIIENQQILFKIYNISKNTNVHYIIGNHDYTIQSFYNNFKKNFPNEKYAFEVGKFLRRLPVRSNIISRTINH